MIMMSVRAIVVISSLFYTASVISTPAEEYLQKFLTYQNWSQHLPLTPEPAFVSFIEKTSPLTQKLREKWLYQLASRKDWFHYNQYYQNSKDINLQCYGEIAHYYQGRRTGAIEVGKKLWLNGESQPKPCETLFTLLLTDHEIDNTLIQQRISLALEKRNLELARYLLKQCQPAQVKEADLLSAIHQNPLKSLQLQSNPLHREFYLYGLKLLVQRNIKKAVSLWETQKSPLLLAEKQQQDFIAHVALYKAMRHQADAPQWFAKINLAFANDAILDWQIRYALAHHQWLQVLRLIHYTTTKDGPQWQYWTARALEAINEQDKAKAIYQALAEKRHYYGFLASSRLKQRFHFEDEPLNTDESLLQSYQPVLNQVKNLYQQHQILTASRLLNDFSLELSKQEKSALAAWVMRELQWYGKSVYMSNTEDLNNQLGLRFPLAYQNLITQNAERHHLPPALIYAMIRQESAFREDISSPAGASGLMQIMPFTAKLVAQSAKITYRDIKELYSTSTNIHLGTAYLQQLARQYHAHPALMAAAYNAGPRQVNYWLKNLPTNELDIWVETIPWQETRNYLKNVIAFYAVYQYRLHETPSLESFMQPLQNIPR